MLFDRLYPSPVPALQSLVELGALWEAAARLPARRVVEVGSLYGGSLWYWLQLPGVQEVVSVDLVTDNPEVRPGVLAARAQWPSWAEHLTVIEADSHDPATAQLVGPPVDLVFLDGDHLVEGVALDWVVWAPLVRPGGLVAFHDTVANGDRDEPGVRAVVADLKRHHPSTEWFAPDGAGITAFQL